MTTEPAAGAVVLETPRLVLRRLTPDDAPLMLELLNDETYRRFIGDRHVRTIEEARKYIADGPIAMYEKHGFGLWLVVRKADGVPIGICGLLKRDELPDVDVGFALLPAWWRQGYGREAATAVLEFGYGPLGLTRIVAITHPENVASQRLLEALGLRRDPARRPPGKGESLLFVPVPGDGAGSLRPQGAGADADQA
ncbi:MAG: GNAT family N-acetyltransferase [Vicinamibacterales bacterium]